MDLTPVSRSAAHSPQRANCFKGPRVDGWARLCHLGRDRPRAPGGRGGRVPSLEPPILSCSPNAWLLSNLVRPRLRRENGVRAGDVAHTAPQSSQTDRQTDRTHEKNQHFLEDN